MTTMTDLRHVTPEFDIASTIHEDLGHETPLTHHPDYYFDDGNLVILVENTLFRVFRSTFTRHSSVFSDLFTLPEPSGAVAEGSTDDNPLFFSGISAIDFERLLWVIYPPSYGIHKAHTLDEWLSILNLATRWEFTDIRVLAIRSIQLLDITPVDRILLSRDYDIQGRWTLSAYTALCERSEPLTIAEATLLGLETSVRIAQMREQLRGSSRSGGGYSSLTSAAAGRRVKSQNGRPERLQWDIGRSFFDQGAISPPVRPTPRKTGLKSASGPSLSRTARLVAEAFGLDVSRR